ncbi:MAG: hypothetical protein QOG42_367 [Solirubrobacteraceae bacterium]|jgi:hypothetical protein|nr:hypothetical protein [Solirubrobacteraceae bacterium]
MSNSRSNARPRRSPALDVRRRAALSLVLAAAAALAMGAGPAGAHGGDAQLIHSCIGGGGNIKIVGADESCKKNELSLDWARDSAGNTYSAGSGLSLSPTNVFSVTGAPWSGLTGVPAGFADGVDDVGVAPTWTTLAGVPADLRDGDDDGSAAASAAVSGLRTSLGQDDGVPNEASDPVSFSKIKDLTSISGDGRITGAFIRDLSLTGADLADRSLNGDKIADGSIRTRHLAPGVLDRIDVTTTVDPPQILPTDRVAVEVPLAGFTTVSTHDIVTASPPAGLEHGLVYAGSDVLPDGRLVVYLQNITTNPIDASPQAWTVRQLRTGG